MTLEFWKRVRLLLFNQIPHFVIVAGILALLAYAVIYRLKHPSRGKGYLQSFRDGYTEGRINAMLAGGLSAEQAVLEIERQKLERKKVWINQLAPLVGLAGVVGGVVALFLFPIGLPIWLFLCYRLYRQTRLFYEEELPAARARLSADESALRKSAGGVSVPRR